MVSQKRLQEDWQQQNAVGFVVMGADHLGKRENY